MYRVEIRLTVDADSEKQLDEVLEGIVYPNEVDHVDVTEVLNEQWKEI